jgi:segregation and condensation protein A
MNQFQIKTEVFEGPLELLLNLIEKRKLLINDISLSKVTDDFINHVKGMTEQNMPMSETAHFILIASTLLLIKSKSLLPSLSLTEDEQSDIQDLERRLTLYAKIKEASVHVKRMFGAQPMFASCGPRKMVTVFAPSKEITLATMCSSIRDALKRIPVKEKLAEVIVKKVISLEEMIGTLSERIAKNISMSFREFSSMGKAEKVDVIVGFLAMLELVKQGMLHVKQEKDFDDILMETKDVGIPRYG